MLSIIEYELSSLASGACNVHRVLFLDKILYSYFLLARVSLELVYKRVQANCQEGQACQLRPRRIIETVFKVAIYACCFSPCVILRSSR